MKITPEQINQLLPQTQCELCEYPGCKPYSEAIAFKGEAIDRCLPGGVETLKKLAILMGQDPATLIKGMEAKQKKPLLAVIDEAVCIGCKKCINACPVDAILGAAKQMHTVIRDECTGCELCVDPCPVDCIDLLEVEPFITPEKSAHFKTRYEARQVRLHREMMEKAEQHRKMKQGNVESSADKIKLRKQAIQAAIERSKKKS